MHYYFKMGWFVRAVVYKLFFKRILMPGYIGPPLFVFGARKIEIGKRVRIFPGLRAEVHGSGRIIIEDDIVIGQGFHITSMGEIVIGSGSAITGYVSVTDIEHEYSNVGIPVIDQKMELKKTKIGKNCFIGMGARIQAGTVLGDGCIVGANAVVRGTFPDHSVLVGSPARVIKHFNPESHQWERL